MFLFNLVIWNVWLFLFDYPAKCFVEVAVLMLGCYDFMLVLNNIFPAGICDEICSYNLHCSKCKDLREKEYRYITYNQDYFEDKEINSVAEKQIYVFKTRMEASPIDLSDNVNDRQMRREINILMKSPTLKKGIFLQATKSYVKKNLGHTYQMLEDLHNINAIKNSWMFPSLNRYYEFRNIDFRLKDLFLAFLAWIY